MEKETGIESTNAIASPKLSIVMPTYNGIAFVKEAVNSVFAQAFQDWELIISDDGSSDGTRDYLDTLTDSRVRICKQQINLGIFGNLNFLFAQARAELTLILCQDDYLVPGALDTVIGFWQTLPETVGFIRFNWNPYPYGQQCLPPVIFPKDSDHCFFVFGNLSGNLSNVSVKTKLVAEVGGFRTDLPYAGDFEFWSRLARTVSFGLTKDKISVVRRHPETASMTLNRRGELVRQAFDIADGLYIRVRQNHRDWLPRLFANLMYDVRQRDAALRSFVKTKNNAYLRQVQTAKPQFQLPAFMCWCLYFFTIGGRYTFPQRYIGRLLLARNMDSLLLTRKGN